MQTVTIEELIDYKILPFDIFTEDEKLLFSAGEVMTPGKFLKIRHVEKIYKKEETAEQTYENNEAENVLQEHTGPDEFLINRYSIFLKNEQTELQKANAEDVIRIISDNSNKIANENYVSKLRLLGDYDVCHSSNTAILACALSQKLGKNREFVEHIVSSIIKFEQKTEEEQEIVDICAYFDDLLFNRTEFDIKTAKDALKKILEIGAKRFPNNILYAFVYMFNYNDTKLFHEMLI